MELSLSLPPVCSGKFINGQPCRFRALDGSDRCGRHRRDPSKDTEEIHRKIDFILDKLAELKIDIPPDIKKEETKA